MKTVLQIWETFCHFYWYIPPCGYDSVTLNFNYEAIYPTASTCALELTIPTRHTDYNVFKQHMDVAFLMNGGFGLA